MWINNKFVTDKHIRRSLNNCFFRDISQRFGDILVIGVLRVLGSKHQVAVAVHRGLYPSGSKIYRFRASLSSYNP